MWKKKKKKEKLKKKSLIHIKSLQQCRTHTQSSINGSHYYYSSMRNWELGNWLRELPVETKAGVCWDRTVVVLSPFWGHFFLKESDESMDNSLHKRTYAYVTIHKVKVESPLYSKRRQGAMTKPCARQIYERTEVRQSRRCSFIKGRRMDWIRREKQKPWDSPSFPVQRFLPLNSSQIPACLLTSLDRMKLA